MMKVREAKAERKKARTHMSVSSEWLAIPTVQTSTLPSFVPAITPITGISCALYLCNKMLSYLQFQFHCFHIWHLPLDLKESVVLSVNLHLPYK